MRRNRFSNNNTIFSSSFSHR